MKLIFEGQELISSDGKSAYEIAVENGFIGTQEEWLKSLTGEPGQNATINGQDTVEIVAGENVSIKQDGGMLTISASGGVTLEQVNEAINTAISGAIEGAY